MRILLLICGMVLGTGLQAQVLLKGRVTDSLGNAIAEVTVSEQGRPNTVRTDREGYFEIRTMSTRGQLLFRHVGFRRQMQAFDGASPDIAVVMLPSGNYIDEVLVVNTGYQTLSRERSTGSFEHIDQAALDTRTGFDILEKIEGLAPGLQFDNRSGSPTLTMRGISTMTSTRMEPLIILDNFPYQGDIANINPHDIESVTLLKDAAATSIWGARAGNGVIVITSRQAREKERPQLSYSTNLDMAPRPDLWYDQRLGTADFIDVEMFLFDRGHYNTAYTGSRKRLTIFSPVVDMLYAHKNGDLSEEDLRSAIAGLRKIDYLDEIRELFYQPPLRQQHHVSLSSGTSRLSSRLSIGYDQGKGAAIGNSSSRFTGKASGRFAWSRQLDVDFSLSYSNQSGTSYADLMDEGYQPGGSRTAIYPYVRFRDDSGIPLAVPRLYNPEYIAGLRGEPLLDWDYVPLEDIGTSVSRSGSQHFQGQSGITWRPLSGLSLSAMYNVERQAGSTSLVRGEESYHMRNLINRFTQVSGTEVKHILPPGASRSDNMGHLFSHNLRGQATYSRTWAVDHDVSVIAGSELSHRESNDQGFLLYGYDQNRMTSQPVDYVNTYPVYDGLASNARIPNIGGFSSSLRRYVSFYGNVGYLYKDRYGLSFSARRDASNIFGVRTNDRWNPLWSTGISWQITKESFMQDIVWVDRLNLRITYGHSGNSGGAANYLPTISYAAAPSGSTTLLPRAYVTRLSNPDLRWEDVATTNIGLDFSFFGRAIDGHVELFRKRSTDLLSDDLIDITTGFSTITRNVASLDGRGGELRLTGSYRQGKFAGKTTVNASLSRTRVREMYGTIGLGRLYAESAGRTMRPLPDKELYPVLSFRFAGLNPENGNPQGIYQGEVSEDYARLVNDSLQNLTYHGTALPPYHGTFIQEFAYGRLTLSFLFAFKFGHYFQKSTVHYNNLFNSWAGHSDYARRWQKPGDEEWTDVPAMVYPAVANRDNFYASSDANILSGDLIRMQDVSLSYGFRINTAGRPISGQVFGKANGGMPIWTKNRFGLDPDYFGRPPQRRYSVGVQLSF